MLDKLLDALWSCIELLQFWTVISEYERGVVLHFGRFNGRVLDPGIHWTWPFHIDVVHYDNVTTRTHILSPQALTTKDGRTISVTAVVTSNIKDIRKSLLEVEGVTHALNDSCCAAIGAHVASLTWDELRTELAASELVKSCRRRAFSYGIEIERVQLADMALCKVLRIHGIGDSERLSPITH